MSAPDFVTPAVVEALGAVPEWTDEEVALLGVLLDPRNDPWGREETTDDALEAFRYFTGFDIDEDRSVAERLRTHHNRTDGYGAFEFEHLRDGDGCVGGYNVLTHVAPEPGLWLACSDDIKYLGGGYEELTGLRAALRTASTLEGDWQRLRSAARRLGLAAPAEETPTPAPSVWPDTDEEKAAFADWQYEVANGDTCIGFRDWFTHRGTEDTDT